MRSKLLLAALAVLALVACITINVYFPEEAIRDLSQQIEAEVQEQATGEPAPSEPAPEPTSPPAEGGPLAAILSLGASTAWADQEAVPAPEITNPAIRTIIASRADRLEELNRWKATGVVGETNRALVEIRDLSAVPGLKERADLQRLVRAENADREQLFREIAAAKNVELSQLDRIRATYAETLRANARPGDWIQQPDGEWVRKAE
jgi:uncharacterized protein YdbL (DUF1318 family)